MYNAFYGCPAVLLYIMILMGNIENAIFYQRYEKREGMRGAGPQVGGDMDCYSHKFFQ